PSDSSKRINLGLAIHETVDGADDFVTSLRAAFDGSSTSIEGVCVVEARAAFGGDDLPQPTEPVVGVLRFDPVRVHHERDLTVAIVVAVLSGVQAAVIAD